MSRKKRNNYQSNYEVNYKGGYNYDKRVILSKLDKIDNKINKIDDDLNSNPFTRLFRKHNLRYILTFLLTCLIMVSFYVEIIYFIYDGIFNLKNTFEILGNGFYWILAGIIYFGISFLKKGDKDGKTN